MTSWVAFNAILGAGALLVGVGLASPSLAAPTARLRVDAKGALRIPAATIKALKVKTARDGSFWVQFPQPKRPAAKPVPAKPVVQKPRTGHDDHDHEHMAPPSPLKVLTAVDRGVAVVPRTHLENGVYVPGQPGTLYVATGSGNTLLLSRP
jgi:hypothetical protein